MIKYPITLKEAKELSLARWRHIQADLPNVRLFIGLPDDRIYGECGFCLRYRRARSGCESCELFNIKACNNYKDSSTLFWSIVYNSHHNIPIDDLVKKMIEAIESVEVKEVDS